MADHPDEDAPPVMVPCEACPTKVPHAEAHLIAPDYVYLCDACFGEMDERGMGRPAAPSGSERPDQGEEGRVTDD